MASLDKLVLFRDAMRELGIPDGVVDSHAAIAVQNAIDMGYSDQFSVAHMARKILRLPER